MKKFREMKKVWLTAAAIALVGGIRLNGAIAYFTTSVSADGGRVLELGNTTEIEEGFENWTKDIKITNTGDVECFVRVKVLAGSQFALQISGEGWEDRGDGYWYYKAPVEAGQQTGSLFAKIQIPEEFAEDFNVAVVQESTPALYNENGEAYADWELAVNEGGM